MSSNIRDFGTGAVRDTDDGKLDYEAALSPAVLERYVGYLADQRTMSDGSLRDFDNWQGGMPKQVYMKSGIRHLFDLWKLHRGIQVDGVSAEEACCAILFNVMGYLFETLRDDEGPDTDVPAICYGGTLTIPYREPDQWAQGGRFIAAVGPHRDEADERTA